MKPTRIILLAAALALALALPSAAAADLVEAPGSPIPVGAEPFWVAIADLDGSDRPDLAVANDDSTQPAGSVSVLLQQSGGAFAPETGSPFTVGQRPDSVAVADFDGDSRLDLAAANFFSDSVTVLLQQAAGGFAEAPGSPFDVGDRPHSVLAADLDGDGSADLATPNYVANDVTILLNDGAGGFDEEAGSPVAVGAAPTQIGAADFDGDGRGDLAVAGYHSDNVTILLRQATGGYAEEAGSPIEVGTNPVAAAPADFDGDGRPDLAVTNEGSDDVTILLRQAGGGFAPEAGSPIAAGDGPYGAAARDLNRDGRPDLAVTNFFSNDLTVLLRKPGGGFAHAPFSPVKTGSAPHVLAAGDLDGDGRIDLAVPNNADNTVSVLRNVTDTTIDARPPDPTNDATPGFAFSSTDPDATFECAFDDAAFAPCTTPLEGPALANGKHTFKVRAIDSAANADPTPAEDEFTVDTTPPPPRNLALPQIVDVTANTYECRPGSWDGLDLPRPFRFTWQRLTPDNQYFSGYRADTVATGQIFRASAATKTQLLSMSWRFQCVVEAINTGGTTTATSPMRVLDPALDEPDLGAVYGNLRIRGIDVFQVVQPTAMARAFGYEPGVGAGESSQSFGFELAGGGTPTSYVRTYYGGALPAGANPQRTVYAGVPLDATKPATAVVYVDVDALTGGYSATQRLDVTLSARVDGARFGSPVTDTITAPHFGRTPYVTAAERDDRDAGVQLQIPPRWLERAAAGARLDLEAAVAFPRGFGVPPRQCSSGSCTGDDRYRLDDLPAARLPRISITSVDLREQSDTWNTTPQAALQRATELFPGGERMSIFRSGSFINITDVTGWTINSSQCAFWKGMSEGLRWCRASYIDDRLNDWEARNQGLAYDVLFGIHEYDSEPGWTQRRRPDFTKLPSNQGHPTFTANHGSLNRPLTAAAHELGHVLGLPHAGQACPAPIGYAGNQTGRGSGQAGEYWPQEDRGRLQGVKFDRTGARDARGRIDPMVDNGADPAPPTVTFALLAPGLAPVRQEGPENPPNPGNLVDLMSYCSVSGDATFPWLSARNWNHTFRVLRDWVGRLSPIERVARLAAVSSETYAVGVIGPDGGRIERLVPPDGDSRPPAAAPSSAVRLRSLDATGKVLRDAGVAVQGASEAPPEAGGSFIGPVAAGAVAVELVRGGEVLHRLERSRPPVVRVSSPRRAARVRGRGGLAVRWSASDGDRDALHATIDYSPDDGRTWTTVFQGPDAGRARIDGRSLAASRRGRLRVAISDGFSETRAVSERFRADGTPATVRIVRPETGEALRAGERTLLLGSALDDRRRPLRGRSLTWYAGGRRLGSGERVTARLPGGRYALRLVARDAAGRTSVARQRVRVQRSPLRLLRLSYARRVARGAREIAVTIRTSERATLRVAGSRHRVGRRARRILVALSPRPRTGELRIPCRIVTGDGRRLTGAIEVRRG